MKGGGSKPSPEKMEGRDSIATSTAMAVEDAKKRCVSLIQRLTKSKLSPSPKTTLLRLIQSELTFLHRVSTTSDSSPLSFNIGHLEAVMHVLQQPFITGVSRICKSISLSPSHSIYIDIICSLNGNPVWFIVSDRNPRYISWDSSSSHKNKGLKEKIQQVVDAARHSPITLRPLSIVLFFSNGLDDNVSQMIKCEFGGVNLELMDPFSYEEVELEEEWMNVVLSRSFSKACVFQIVLGNSDGEVIEENPLNSARIDGIGLCEKLKEFSDLNLGASLCSLVYGMKCWCCSLDDIMVVEAESKLINFDTTAMVAIVSGISNGGTEKLLAIPESELKGRFKGNYDFVIAQVTSENHNSIHVELSGALSGKRGIISESVCSEFQDLISMVGGPNEKLRAKYFLKFLKVVPDYPSKRLMSLPTTRKMAMKNKLVFGTGDYWHAPTVTANIAFVRAVTQTGMSLSVIEHRPRALIGD